MYLSYVKPVSLIGNIYWVLFIPLEVFAMSFNMIITFNF